MSVTTQQTLVQTLREQILSGQPAPGQRLVELQLAERLGVSDTPLHHALNVLTGEGLIEPSSQRSFAVRRFSVPDALDAIDVHGVLEGLAARTVAERGADASLLATLGACLDEGARLFAQGSRRCGDNLRYAALNHRLHEAIIAAAGNAALSAAMRLNDKAPSSRQHHAIVKALQRGEGARVEAPMKDHTQISKDSLNLAPGKLGPAVEN